MLKKHYGAVGSTLLSLRLCGVSKFPGKMHYVTLEWPLSLYHFLFAAEYQVLDILTLICLAIIVINNLIGHI